MDLKKTNYLKKFINLLKRITEHSQNLMKWQIIMLKDCTILTKQEKLFVKRINTIG